MALSEICFLRTGVLISTPGYVNSSPDTLVGFRLRKACASVRLQNQRCQWAKLHVLVLSNSSLVLRNLIHVFATLLYMLRGLLLPKVRVSAVLWTCQFFDIPQYESMKLGCKGKSPPVQSYCMYNSDNDRGDLSTIITLTQVLFILVVLIYSTLNIVSLIPMQGRIHIILHSAHLKLMVSVSLASIWSQASFLPSNHIPQAQKYVCTKLEDFLSSFDEKRAHISRTSE
jgi:hypothetical protein